MVTLQVLGTIPYASYEAVLGEASYWLHLTDRGDGFGILRHGPHPDRVLRIAAGRVRPEAGELGAAERQALEDAAAQLVARARGREHEALHDVGQWGAAIGRTFRVRGAPPVAAADWPGVMFTPVEARLFLPYDGEGELVLVGDGYGEQDHSVHAVHCLTGHAESHASASAARVPEWFGPALREAARAAAEYHGRLAGGRGRSTD
ncbi:hypothetical protein E7744_01920 [Citricoccus sp. SGAir0253]|uniref:hypothetical protein n=1 Tax=Citricoccus sp. SGAir0253 TaxID=2567881 RepID=UPI0010CD4462|nr:hypothetical protein [Citricoccus sp. SGAir0253]QCU77117.1 hypothetical protein E7744_01920 [Citricoccus sp. SGAir0253]